jgi:hypothetical protein
VKFDCTRIKSVLYRAILTSGVLTACSLAEIDRRFGGTYCLLCLLLFSLGYSSILKTEAVRFSETSLIYGTRRRSVTDGSRPTAHRHFCESFRASILMYWLNCGALCYKPESRGFDSGWGGLDLFLIYLIQPHYGPGVDSAPNRNEYHEDSWG